MDFIVGAYDVWRGLHILAVIAWMAGLLYLPRLYVRHVRATPGSELDVTLQDMEAKLLKIIMTPASIAALVFGVLLIAADSVRLGPEFLIQPAMIVKLIGVVFLFGFHGFLSASRKRFAAGQNTRPEKFWRMVNELPFVAAIFMVLAVTIWVR